MDVEWETLERGSLGLSFVVDRVQEIGGAVLVIGRVAAPSAPGRPSPGFHTVVLWRREEGRTAGISQFGSVESALDHLHARETRPVGRAA